MFVFDRDPDGPSRVWEFKRFVHGIFAQWLNWRWSTSGKVFDPNVLSQQFAILDIREEENQIQYIENNMLAAGIIDFDGRLEGAVSKRDYLLEPLVIERPSSWFQARTWPDTATIQLEVPPKAKAAGFTRETWWSSTRVSTYLAQMEAFERRLASGKRLRFVDEVLAESPHRPRKTKISHRRIPCASSEKLRRAVFRRKRLGFLRQYRRSMEQLAEGLADVMFPWGTCLMTSCHGLPMHAKAG